MEVVETVWKGKRRECFDFCLRIGLYIPYGHIGSWQHMEMGMACIDQLQLINLVVA